MAWVTLRPAGGQANTASPSARPPGFAERLRNVYYRAGRWVRRLGTTTLHSLDYSDRLTAAWAYKLALSDSAAQYDLMAATAGNVAGPAPCVVKRSGTGLVAIPTNGVSLDVASGEEWRPWIHAAHGNQKGFMCRRGWKPGNGILCHVTPNQVTAAGIPAPITAPTLGVGAAGALTGTWNAFAYSFLTDDGIESNAIYYRGNVALAAQRLRWSGLEAPTHPRVTKWRLYRAKVGASNTIAFECEDIAITTPLPYDSNVLDTALGNRSAPSRNYEPPASPEHVCPWDDRIFLTTNDEGGPGWHYTTIGEHGPEWEAYDPSSRLLRLAPVGGKRAQASLAWDVGEARRLALLTDNVIAVAAPTAEPDVYSIAELEGSRGHGVLSAHAAAVGGNGMLVWYCGQHVHMSDGGPAEIISEDWIEETLAGVPDAYRERAFMAWRIKDGGFFALAIPSTDSSTENDLELCWHPRQGWHERQRNVTGAKAVTFCASIEPGASTRTGNVQRAIDIGLHAADNRIFWLDSPNLKDAGLASTGDVPVQVHVEMILPAIPTPTEGEQVVCGGIMFNLERRRDVDESAAWASPGDTGLTAKLRLDGERETASVTISRESPNLRVVYARAQNLGDVADYVQPIIEGDPADAIEIAQVLVDVEAVGLRRAG